MNFTDTELRLIKLVMKDIIENEDDSLSLEDPIIGPPSLLKQFRDIQHNNKKLTGFLINQIINSIVKPWAAIFFLSNHASEKGADERLKTFLLENTKSLALFY